MALKQLKTVDTSTVTTSKSKIPVINVDMNITAFVNLDREAKDAKARRDEVADEVRVAGLNEIYKLNCGRPGAPETSVKLQDGEGSVATISMQERYSVVDSAAAEALFEELGKDINQYVQQVVTVKKFDNSVFLDKNGTFDEGIYKAFVEAVNGVAKKLKIANPLQTAIEVQPKPSFHTIRFTEFNAKQQARISETLKSTVTVKAS